MRIDTKIQREVSGGPLPSLNRKAKAKQRQTCFISLKQVESYLDQLPRSPVKSLPNTMAGLELWVWVAEATEAEGKVGLQVDLSQASPDCRNLATRLTYGRKSEIF